MKIGSKTTPRIFVVFPFILGPLVIVFISGVRAQTNFNVPPTGCPPTPPVACCQPGTTSTSQTWPKDAHVNVNIDPNFSPEQRSAIEQSFNNWQAAGNSANAGNNGSGFRVNSFTSNPMPLSMQPPPGTY